MQPVNVYVYINRYTVFLDCSSGEPISHEDRTLLVTSLDVSKLRVIEKGVVYRQRPDTGNAKESRHTFGQQRFGQRMST